MTIQELQSEAWELAEKIGLIELDARNKTEILIKRLEEVKQKIATEKAKTKKS